MESVDGEEYDKKGFYHSPLASKGELSTSSNEPSGDEGESEYESVEDDDEEDEEDIRDIRTGKKNGFENDKRNKSRAGKKIVVNGK